MVAVIQLAITLGASVGGLLFDGLGYRATFAPAPSSFFCRVWPRSSLPEATVRFRITQHHGDADMLKSAQVLSRRSALGITGPGAAFLLSGLQPTPASAQTSARRNNAMQLTQEWDKKFARSTKVDHRKVTFKNRYGITLAADLYLPKERGSGQLAALAVSGPFGAVKEQSSGLYAQTMAERGFAALAFDPSYTGESGGAPRKRGIARHQHRGLQRRSRLSGHAGLGRSAAHRHHWDLRLRRNGPERRCRRQAGQGRRRCHHVRHVAPHGERLQRQGHPRRAHQGRSSSLASSVGRMPSGAPSNTARR